MTFLTIVRHDSGADDVAPKHEQGTPQPRATDTIATTLKVRRSSIDIQAAYGAKKPTTKRLPITTSTHGSTARTSGILQAGRNGRARNEIKKVSRAISLLTPEKMKRVPVARAM